MQKIKAFEITDHGYDHAQYFQGAGVGNSDFTHCFLGAGNNAKDAYEDAADQAAQSGWDTDKLPTRPRGIRKSDKVPASHQGEDNEFYWYVSIRVR